MPFDSDVFCCQGMHDCNNNCSRLTCTADGIYFVSAQMCFEPNGNGTTRDIQLMKNGTTLIAKDSRVPLQPPYATIMSCHTLVAMKAGDYIETIVFQDSGTPLKINVEPDAPDNCGPRLMMGKMP